VQAQTYLDARGATARAGLVAFGCPNVGDSAFAKAAAKAVNIRRLEFENDPVAALPCASGKADGAVSMPACADATVPTSAGDPGASPVEYWSE
jgi:hypothetical protein